MRKEKVFRHYFLSTAGQMADKAGQMASEMAGVWMEQYT